jgi:hypothetical protein
MEDSAKQLVAIMGGELIIYITPLNIYTIEYLKWD